VAEGNPVSVAMTLIDGIVLARSIFHHSVNYRSVVVHGTGRLLESDEEKLSALEAVAEHIARGRWADTRPPSRKELKATSVVSILTSPVLADSEPVEEAERPETLANVLIEDRPGLVDRVREGTEVRSKEGTDDDRAREAHHFFGDIDRLSS